MWLLACAAGPAYAQRIAGHGDDAIQLPKGSWRVRIGGRWDQAAERIDDVTANGRVPLGALLARDSLGARALPSLAAAEAAARRLTGLNDLSLSVGQLSASLTERAVRLPLALEIGLTRRLAIGVFVPYVETRALPDLVLNPTGATGAFGPNPARITGFSAAATANTRALTRNLGTARSALRDRLTACLDNAAAFDACSVILAERAQVEAILAATATMGADLRALYGEAAGTGGAVVPIAGSTADRLIGARLRGLGKDFGRYGVSADTLTAASVSFARTRYGTGAVQRLWQDTAFGVVADSLRPVRRYGMGDVDVTASWLVIDRITQGNKAPLARFDGPRRFAIRSLLEGGWRFGSAAADRPSDPFDVPIGAGASALLLRSSTDIIFSSRTWLSATARAMLPQEDIVLTRLPTSLDPFFAPVASTVAAQRTLGRSIDVEIAPRAALTNALGLSAVWTWRTRAADRYAVLPTTPSPNVSLPSGPRSTDGLVAGTAQQEQRLSIGITYSTLAPFARGRSKHAVELLYEHSEPLTGSGRFSAFAFDRFEVRWYPGYARR